MKKQILAIILLSTVLWQCTSPERKFEKAEKKRSKLAFEQFIETYPESPLVEKAIKRLSELSFWEQIDSTLKEENYQSYLDSFPDGLFQKETQKILHEIEVFKKVQQQDIIEAYNSFSEEFPESFFADSLANRIKYLKPALEEFHKILADTSTLKLKIYISEFRTTGYGRLIQTRLDSISLPRSEIKIVSQAIYQNLPKKLDLLLDYIENENERSKVLLAKQAIEHIIIEQINIAGIGSRFVLPELPIYTGIPESRFSIKSIEKPTNTHYVGKGKRGSLVWNSKFTTMGANKAIFLTEYPNDRLVYKSLHSIIGLEVGTGSLPHTLFDLRIHSTNNTVWRFYGEISIIPKYKFIGDTDDPLSLYLMESVGAVYLHGKGSIVKEDGQVIFSNLK